jgi:hypothetical protein
MRLFAYATRDVRVSVPGSHYCSLWSSMLMLSPLTGIDVHALMTKTQVASAFVNADLTWIRSAIIGRFDSVSK